MAEYIDRDNAIELLSQPIVMSMCLSVDECHNKRAQRRIDRYLIENIPAADVVGRDEGIRIGAELAAMHGSDATSQDLEEAYWTGYEEAMKKCDVRPVVRARWITPPKNRDYAHMIDYYECPLCGFIEDYSVNFCPNCGARMEDD